jgi:hypothetical protein
MNLLLRMPPNSTAVLTILAREGHLRQEIRLAPQSQKKHAALGKSAIVPRFLAQFNIRSKAGGHGFPMSLDGSVIKADSSLAEWMSIPFKARRRFNHQSFLFGSIVNDLYVPCSGASCPPQNLAARKPATNVAEAARSTIRQALLTW